MSLTVPKRLKGQSPSHARSRIQEKQTAKRLGGRVTVGSGNKHEKGDVRVKGVVRVESKTTIHRSFSVTRQMIEKVEQACFGADEVPVMEIEIEGGLCSVYVVPKAGFEMLLDAAVQRGAKDGTV